MHTEISFPNLGIYLKNVGKSIDFIRNRDSVLRNHYRNGNFAWFLDCCP